MSDEPEIRLSDILGLPGYEELPKPLPTLNKEEPEPEMEIRIVKVCVVKVGDEIFSESSTDIEIEDEGGGEFIVITQSIFNNTKVAFNPSDWPTIRQAINEMVARCRE